MVIFSEYETNNIDITIDFLGFEDCKPKQGFGPSIRSNFVLHYITKGLGNFYYKDKSFSLKKGDLFLLKPNELTYYQADNTEPWSYYRIGINGNKVKDHISLSTIYEDSYIKSSDTCDTKSIEKIIETMIIESEDKEEEYSLKLLKLIGQTYEILYQLLKISPAKNNTTISNSEKIYLDCRRIIETQYDNTDLSIKYIAEDLNVNRSYLTKIFKEYANISPKRYLNQIRMRRSSQLLKNTREPIKVIAYSVGFKDPLYFSKAFKNFYKKSPSDYRWYDIIY